MEPKVWWQQLNKELETFSKKYSGFAEIKDGQFSIIQQAANIGATLSGSIWHGLSDNKKGDEIEAILKRLPGSLPSIDPLHTDASRELAEIYLKHLKRYNDEVHPQFGDTLKSVAAKFGKDLDKINSDIKNKNIPELKNRLNTLLAVEVKNQGTQTESSSVSSPQLPQKTQTLDFSTAQPQDMAVYAQQHVQQLERDLKSSQSRLYSLKKGKQTLMSAIGAREKVEERQAGYSHPDYKKLERDIMLLGDAVEKLKAESSHYNRIKDLSENKDAKSQNIDIKDELVNHRAPLLIEEVIAEIKGFGYLPGEVQVLIRAILEAAFEKPAIQQRIWDESEKDYSGLLRSLVLEVKAIIEGVGEVQFTYLGVPPQRVDDVLQNIKDTIPNFARLDSNSRRSLETLLIGLLNKPNLFALLAVSPHAEQITAKLVDTINAAMYDKWGSSEKGIYLEGHGKVAIQVSKIYTQVQPLNEARLAKVILTAATQSSTKTISPPPLSSTPRLT